MKKTAKLKLIAIFLCLIMVIPTFPIVSAAEDVPEFIEGETVYHPVLTGSGNGVPDGWLAVPETQVPWYNGGTDGAWTDLDANNTHNKKIDVSKFKYTSQGLMATIGQCDFSIVFPALIDNNGNPVTDYVYSITVSGYGNNASGSLGPITDAQGGVDYKGGTYLMVYGAGKGSYRHYVYTGKNRVNDVTVSASDSNIITFTSDKSLTLKVYHCNGINYYFANDKFLYSKVGIDGYGGAALNGIGMNFCNVSGLVIQDITVKKATAKGLSSSIAPLGASIRYCDTDGQTESDTSDALRFTASVDKTSELYRYLVPERTYDTSNEKVKFGMLIIPSDLIGNNELTVDTPNVSDTVITKLYSQDDKAITFNVSLFGIPEERQTRSFTARVYVKQLTDNGWEYTYSTETITRSYVGVANLFYEDIEDVNIRARLDYLFRNCESYEGKNAKRLSFCLLSDFHYKQDMYMSSIDDIQAILDRAHNADVDLIMHAGDFCNDYKGSPELTNAYLNNTYGLTALGVVGNHEMETKGNNMKVVTALLNNREVVWGTTDGKIGDGSIGYFYYETNGFRIICLDTNYSYDTKTKAWEHNGPATSGAPSENTSSGSLGPTQLKWLERTLTAAAVKGIPCIVVSHYSFSGVWSSSPDAEAVRIIFKKANDMCAGTVLMAINGHLHTNRAQIVDDVLYFDMNATRNVVWRSDKVEHYNDSSHTFKYVTYNSDGSPQYAIKKSLNSLSMGKNTWFSADPLSAIVTVSTSGRITIEGMQSEWIYGVVPPNTTSAQGPVVLTASFDLPIY